MCAGCNNSGSIEDGPHLERATPEKHAISTDKVARARTTVGLVIVQVSAHDLESIKVALTESSVDYDLNDEEVAVPTIGLAFIAVPTAGQ